VIAVSGKILKEYRGKVSHGGMTQYIFERKLREIENRGKLKMVPESILRLHNIEKKPNDKYDEKFLHAAVAREAGCIITTDPGLLELDPYKSGSVSVRVLRPEEYPDKLSDS
jgi:predicted nucleic acid-binding protein